MALMSPSIFRVDERMNPIASGTSSVAAVRTCAGTLVIGSDDPVWARMQPRLRARLAGKAHNIDQWRAKIMGHDIGETLYFLVRPGEVRGALLDSQLETGI